MIDFLKNKTLTRLMITATFFCAEMPLGAVIEHKLDTKAPLKCTFSSSHHNRIMVDNGRIIKVVATDLRISTQMESESGQVFISTLDEIPEAITLAVVTENKLIQDLEITFEDKSAEVVILRESDPEEEEPKEIEVKEELDTVTSKIAKIFNAETPIGYTSSPVKCEKSTPKAGLEMEALALFCSSTDVIRVFKLTNISRREMDILEKEVQSNGDGWVFLEKNKLKPKENIICIISEGYCGR